MRLSISVHELADRLPQSKRGLGAQVRRASSSVAANIAEGHGRDHLGDYLRHLSFAKGSLTEVETQLLMLRALVPKVRKDIEPLLGLCEEVGKMLSVLSRKLRLKLEPGSKTKN